MARYKLKNSNNTVNCEILNESAGDYIVRFKNGVIQNVPKNRVSRLDSIDEGVLDTVRGAAETVNKYGRKFVSRIKNIAQKVRDFIVNVFTVDDFVFFVNENGIISSSHPANCIAGAKMTHSVNFYPGSDVVSVCKDMNIGANPVENYQFSGVYDGPIQFKSYDYLLESCKSSLLLSLNEAEDDRFSKIGGGLNLHGTFHDWIADEIVNSIYEEWSARVAGLKPNTLPMLIWGAPGIGKTSILRSLQQLIESKSGAKISILSVNGGNIGPDDFTMPANISAYVSSNQIDEIGVIDDDQFKGAKRTYIKDLPKDWLPVYDTKKSLSNNPELSNAVANGGGLIKDENGNDKIQNGPGGIFIIDEYSRMSESGMNSLMMTPTSREIGASSTLKFGDRWVIVCLANRKSDMGRNGKSEALTFEPASKTRFNHVNFVPDPMAILNYFHSKVKKARSDFEYAELTPQEAIGDIENIVGNEDSYSDRYVVEPIIYDYLLQDYQKHPGDWGDLYEMYDFKNGELDGEKATCCPRTWEAVSWVLFNKIHFGSEGYKDVTDIPRSELVRLLSGIIGKDPALRFATFVSTRSVFTVEDAKNVWEKGDEGNYKVLNKIDSANSQNLMMNHIIPLMKSCSPDLEKYPSAVLNFFKFLELYCSSDKSGAYNGNLFSRAFNEFQNVFNIDLSGQKDEDIYEDTITYVQNKFDEHDIGSN